VIIMKALGGWQGSLEYPQRARWLVSSDPKGDWNPDKSEFIAHFGVDGAERARRALKYVLAHDITIVMHSMYQVGCVTL
jgi:hypothetical protein